MKRKRILAAMIIIAVLCTGMVFAGGQQDKAPAAATDEPVRVALLTSGPITDGGWNTLAYEGLQTIKDAYGYQIANTENVAQDDQVAIMRDYARAGFDVIIGHGYEYEDAIVTVAAEYPDIFFAQTGGESGGKLPNVTSGVFRTGDAGYVVGRVAGELTQSKRVGFVGAMEIPTIAEEVQSVRATLAKFYPDVTMVVGYTGSWVDAAAGYEAAMAQVTEGVDVIIGIGNAADLGAIQASEELDGKIKYIGWVGDLHSLSPDVIATSMVEDVGWVMRDFIGQYQAGEKGTAGVYGITEGAKYLGTWGDFVPQSVRDLALAEQEKIKSGELTRLQIFDMLGVEPKVIYD
jgi:basic membrane protein A and related proteins